MAKAPGAAAHLAPMLAHIVDAAAANLEPAMVQAWNMGACNNACWSAGEMAMAFPPETLAPHAPRLAAAFCRVLSQTMVHRSLGENAAIALGRFALRCPDHIKQGFAELVTPWCGALRRLRDGVEKEHAFAGLVALARAAPRAASAAGAHDARHRQLQRVRDAELHANLLAVMRHYEALLGPERWAELAEHRAGDDQKARRVRDERRVSASRTGGFFREAGGAFSGVSRRTRRLEPLEARRVGGSTARQ